MEKGATIDAAGWDRLRKCLAEATVKHVKVGVLAAHGGNEKREGGITMVELAAIHEFGSPKANIPERSFIRRTFKLKKRQMAEVSQKLARGLLTEKITVERAYAILGAWGAAEVKKTIVDHKVRPLTSKATNRAKNRRAGKPPGAKTTTLIDTGRMMNSITFQVE